MQRVSIYEMLFQASTVRHVAAVPRGVDVHHGDAVGPRRPVQENPTGEDQVLYLN